MRGKLSLLVERQDALYWMNSPICGTSSNPSCATTTSIRLILAWFKMYTSILVNKKKMDWNHIVDNFVYCVFQCNVTWPVKSRQDSSISLLHHMTPYSQSEYNNRTAFLDDGYLDILPVKSLCFYNGCFLSIIYLMNADFPPFPNIVPWNVNGKGN